MSDKEYRYIGKYVPRKDARGIVTGETEFVDDHLMKDLLYVKNLPCPYAHARIKNIDTSKAEALTGVAAILSYKNVPEFAKEWRRGVPPVKPLLGDKMLYVGDTVALVAAESVDIAKEAIRLIDVEYEVLPAVLDLDEAMAEDAPVLYENCPVYDGNRLNLDMDGAEIFGEKMLYNLKRGDIEKAFAECDHIGGGECKFESFPTPLGPETPGVVCKYDKVEDKYITYASLQSPRPKVVELGKVPPNVVFETHGFNVGGGYGNKCLLGITMLGTAVMARVTGRAAKFIMSKEEQFTIHEDRIGSRMEMRFGMKDGVVHAVQGKWYLTVGFSNLATPCIIGTGMGEMQLALGKCQNWDVVAETIVTNRIPSGVVRGYGGQELKACMMPLVANALRESNIDPIEFYKNNFVGKNDPYIWRDSKWYHSLVDYKHAIDESADAFGWKDKWKGWLIPTSVNGNKVTGVGASVHGNADVGEDNSEATISLKGNGRAVLHIMVNESGMGQRSAVVKMAAEVLNMDYDHVELSSPYSQDNPEDFGLNGSRGTITCGSATVNACEDAKRKLFDLAAPLFRAAPSDLDTKDGFVFLKEQPEIRKSWFEVMGPDRSVIGVGRWIVDYSAPNFCINFVEVEVDKDTGIVEIKKFYVGTDVGQIIDPKACEMQLQGGIGAAALDTGVFEENVLDKYTGRVLTNNLIDYKWRPFNEFPEFGSTILESRPNISKLRALGVGEIAGAPGAAAIAMAISNAIGQEFHEYPATPDKILKALNKV